MRTVTKERIDLVLQAIERAVWGFTWREMFEEEKRKREQLQDLMPRPLAGPVSSEHKSAGEEGP